MRGRDSTGVEPVLKHRHCRFARELDGAEIKEAGQEKAERLGQEVARLRIKRRTIAVFTGSKLGRDKPAYAPGTGPVLSRPVHIENRAVEYARR